MERIVLPDNLDAQLKQTLNQIMDDAQGSVITLTAAPSTAGGEVKENQTGIFGTNIYKTINGVTYRFSGTAV